jgi:hypothetical protein
METDIIDIEIKRLKDREKEISKVVDRYMRIRFKKRFRKLTGINLR